MHAIRCDPYKVKCDLDKTTKKTESTYVSAFSHSIFGRLWYQLKNQESNSMKLGLPEPFVEKFAKYFKFL